MQRDPIQDLIDLLSRLPGVGERTATRLAFFVLQQDASYASVLGETLSNIHQQIIAMFDLRKLWHRIEMQYLR
ncbi:MAG: hypothetical protein R3A47_02670 [Polyangiales bacterium]